MCGIAGLVGNHRGIDSAQAGEAALRCLHHRGPDDHGWLLSSPAGIRTGRGKLPSMAADVMLLHTRLSILDLSEGGWQPMSSADGRYHIVFNGEIYNYLELRAELTALGMVFHTQSDTEVLLAAMARWGVAALPRLIGMFAFAFLDTRERTLLLARDFFGIKPLFYTRKSGYFAFASEIKALWEISSAARSVAPQTLHQYLIGCDTDSLDTTFFADISRLKAAHYLQLSLDHPHQGEPREYWRIDLGQPVDMSFTAATERMRELFIDNIRLHLRSDVPIGTALSGGIDSSSISALARKLAGNRAEYHSFSYVARGTDMDEEKWVDLAAAAARMQVHKIVITPQEFWADVERLIEIQEEPFGSTSIYAQYRVFQQAKAAGVTVLLDGQGADELLAGYQNFIQSRAMSLLQSRAYVDAYRLIRKAIPNSLKACETWVHGFLPASPARAMNTLTRTLLRRSASTSALNTAWFQQQGVSTAEVFNTSTWQPLRPALLHSLTHGLPALLRYEDRNSMAFSIESRVPFLTPQLAQFVYSLPESYLISTEGTTKHIFRQAMRGLVPDALLDRRDKIGFATPERSWLQMLNPWVKQVLTSDAAQAIPAICQRVVQQDTQAILDGRCRFNWKVWRWINLILWSQRFGVTYS